MPSGVSHVSDAGSAPFSSRVTRSTHSGGPLSAARAGGGGLPSAFSSTGTGYARAPTRPESAGFPSSGGASRPILPGSDAAPGAHRAPHPPRRPAGHGEPADPLAGGR